jgi:L-lactate permease
MFKQLLTPVGDSLGLSFFVAILPIIAVLILLGVLRRPAWQAALAGLVVGLVIAVTAWKMPVGLAIHAVLNGGFRALARDVDRDQRAAALQHSRALRSVRCIPGLGCWSSAQ